jgi:hypothetical protein
MKRADTRPVYGVLKGLCVAVVNRLAVILEDATAVWWNLAPTDPFARLQGFAPSF